MKRKIFLFTCIVSIIVMAILLSLRLKNKNAYINDTMEVIEINDIIEKDIIQSVEHCKYLYTKNNYENFQGYFNIIIIDEFLEKGKLEIDDYVIDRDFTFSEIFDKYGQKINTFPVINNLNSSYQIEPNKEYLVKYILDENSYTYYYRISIDSDGDSSLDLLCYIIGENNTVLEEIEE